MGNHSLKTMVLGSGLESFIENKEKTLTTSFNGSNWNFFSRKKISLKRKWGPCRYLPLIDLCFKEIRCDV